MLASPICARMQLKRKKERKKFAVKVTMLLFFVVKWLENVSTTSVDTPVIFYILISELVQLN